MSDKNTIVVEEANYFAGKFVEKGEKVTLTARQLATAERRKRKFKKAPATKKAAKKKASEGDSGMLE